MPLVLRTFKAGEKTVSLVENENERQLWFSSCTKNIERETRAIQSFLELASAAPGDIACDFTFKYEKDNDNDKEIDHLIFKGSLKTALKALREYICLESFEPAVQTLINMLRDRDETEIRDAILGSQKKPAPLRNHQTNDFSGSTTETTPLLQSSRTTLVK